jgi:hypothetical protein
MGAVWVLETNRGWPDNFQLRFRVFILLFLFSYYGGTRLHAWSTEKLFCGFVVETD